MQVGTLDNADALANAKPDAELFVPHRVEWVTEVPKAAQLQGMS